MRRCRGGDLRGDGLTLSVFRRNGPGRQACVCLRVRLLELRCLCASHPSPRSGRAGVKAAKAHTQKRSGGRSTLCTNQRTSYQCYSHHHRRGITLSPVTSPCYPAALYLAGSVPSGRLRSLDATCLAYAKFKVTLRNLRQRQISLHSPRALLHRSPCSRAANVGQRSRRRSWDIEIVRSAPRGGLSTRALDGSQSGWS
jgi:hypothetical protein